MFLVRTFKAHHKEDIIKSLVTSCILKEWLTKSDFLEGESKTMTAGVEHLLWLRDTYPKDAHPIDHF